MCQCLNFVLIRNRSVDMINGQDVCGEAIDQVLYIYGYTNVAQYLFAYIIKTKVSIVHSLQSDLKSPKCML